VLERTSSDTPLQALDLLNDPIYVEAARVFAERAIKEGGPRLAGQLRWAFSRTTGRSPESSELRTLTTLHAGSLARFKANPAAAEQFIHIGEKPVSSGIGSPELAAMTVVTRVMLNLHEVITRD
jgi:hypothetical protein